MGWDTFGNALEHVLHTTSHVEYQPRVSSTVDLQAQIDNRSEVADDMLLRILGEIEQVRALMAQGGITPGGGTEIDYKLPHHRQPKSVASWEAFESILRAFIADVYRNSNPSRNTSLVGLDLEFLHSRRFARSRDYGFKGRIRYRQEAGHGMGGVAYSRDEGWQTSNPEQMQRRHENRMTFHIRLR